MVVEPPEVVLQPYSEPIWQFKSVLLKLGGIGREAARGNVITCTDLTFTLSLERETAS